MPLLSQLCKEDDNARLMQIRENIIARFGVPILVRKVRGDAGSRQPLLGIRLECWALSSPLRLE